MNEKKNIAALKETHGFAHIRFDDHHDDKKYLIVNTVVNNFKPRFRK